MIKRPRVGDLASALVLLLSLALAPADMLGASETARPGTRPAPRLVRHSYMSATTGLERDYYVHVPAGYEDDESRRWPVLLFLHGNGERGNGKDELDWVFQQGPLYEAWIQRRDLEFLIVAPQLPMFDQKNTVDYLQFRDPARMPRRGDGGPPPRPEEFETPEPMSGALASEEIPLPPEGPPGGWDRCEKDLLAILDAVLATYRSDRSRVYLTGLSYGGFGTWYLASRHAERFAAVAPVVGWGHPDLMPPLAAVRMPIWAFAGGRDGGVPARYFFAGMNTLERLGHAGVRFTVHEDMGHDVWERVYGGRDVYDWLLSHRKADPVVAGE